MSKGAFPTQSFVGNYGNFGLPPMAFTNRFMPPKPNYQPLMKMPTQPDPRAGFMSIQQPAPVQTPVQPAPQLPPIEPMVTPTQPLNITPEPLAQAPSLLSVPDRVEQPRDRFMSINRRGDLPPINLFR
jgi:hypothetical protein